MKTWIALAAFALTALVAAPTARADIDWTVTDTVGQAAVATLLLADYIQTQRIIRDPVNEGDRESNPIMRSHRGGLGVSPELYFLSVAGTHALATVALPQLLPRSWRRPARVVLQGALIAIQVESITHNWRAGYTFSF